jgi:dipeptidyl aminopeptidase/acylaminoacyl peptidase
MGPRPFAWVLAAGLVLPAAAQEDVLRPGENLVVDGVGPIPKSLADDVARYTKARAASFVAWHPVKREMLINTFFGETPQVHHVAFPGAARTQLTFFEDRVNRGISYDPVKGEFFLFNKDSGGNGLYQIHRYDCATGKITRLTDGTSRNGAGIWATKGDRIVYPTTRRNGKDADLYVMDPRDPKTDRLLTRFEGSGWSPQAWSPDDSRILVIERISINESYLWSVDVATGEKTLLTPKGEVKAFYDRARFTPDGKSIHLVTDRESEFRRLARFDPAARTFKFLTAHIDWDVSEFEPSPDGRTLALVSNDGGALALHLLDAGSGKERALSTLPPGFVLGIHWHRNGRHLGFSMDSARASQDAFSMDVETGKVERWTFSELAGLDTSAFVEPRIIHWKGVDGLALSGFLYSPPARFAGKRPVIVDVHGGPEEQWQPYFLGRENYLLNELGVALLFPNIRGSAGYGKTFLTLDNGMKREDAYRDIGALLDWIKTQPDLDADRVMVTGISYGGHMTLATAARFPERIRCAVEIVGPSNLVTFLENTADWRRDLRRVEYGDERDPAVRAFLERTAPLTMASKITKPLFVVQGLNDPATPAAEAERIVAAVRANGVPVWYLAAKDEGHGFVRKSNSDYLFFATVLFAQRFLLN